MNAGPTPPPPDNEAPDALLAALRQRLGDYGQAPPPAAWAAIRRRVAPLPPPWWRRPRRLLPLLALLAGLLLVSTPTGQVGLPWVARLLAPAGRAVFSRKAPGSRSTKTTTPARLAVAGNRSPATATATTTSSKNLSPNKLTTTQKTSHVAATPARALEPSALATAPVVSRLAPRLPRSSQADRLPTRLPNRAPAAGRSLHSAATLATQRLKSSRLAAARPATKRPAAAAPASHYRARRPALPALAAASQLPVDKYFAANLPASDPRFTSATSGRGRASQPHLRPGRATRPPALSAELPASLAARAPGVASPAPTRALAAFASQLPASPAATGQRMPVGLLGLRQPSLPLPLPTAPPPVLVAWPDTAAPSVLTRRWSILALAGPTLSYRTLGPAPTLAAGHPDFARLERPALGLGAQVQVRRVLSGRWAVAAGVGYHEYATRLALAKDSAQAIHQRDTYRLLTLPVQLTYALGAPRGRLATGLLLGAEAGWYLGGRSTEGAGCGCEQQTYSATGSPYRSLSATFSLGLDLRYRLGKPDSRWQWLVQPTGRYVATPFVRADAVGFTRRQPFSLGLFTGFSWDVR